MTITAKPINANTGHIDDRSPIGTRYTDGHTTYTLVAYELNPSIPTRALPMFVDEDDLDTPRTEFETLSDGSIPLAYAMELVDGNETLTLAPENPEQSRRARAAALQRYNEPAADTGDLSRVLAFEDLNDEDEVKAFHRWAVTEIALRKAQHALARASRDRADALARIVGLRGSQDKAAAVVGLNQSSVSRALKAATPDRP
ncbi:MAG TPA: hypothetical protein VI172_12735 [Candidatus Dormibacteraeota bacterium]|jgi:hypothetical protein